MRRLVPLTLLLALALGCVTTGAGPQEVVSREDRYYLVSPLERYPLAVGSTTSRRVEEGHTDLLQKGDLDDAKDLTAELLGRNPDLDPARVLRAQAEFIGGEYERAYSGLEPIVREHPTYVSAQLVFGRTAEKLGNLVEALEAYRNIAEVNQLAKSRALSLEPRAVEIMSLRIEDSLDKGHTAEAENQLVRLQEWAPKADRTLELTARVARASDNRPDELEALRSLTVRRPDDRDLLARRGQLELEIGDPAAGMRLFEDLAARYPDDPEVEGALVRARFLWRLQLLPAEVEALADKMELTRADLAAMVYWLFPDIRYGRAGGARIANDILEHPQRDQIVRVVNSGIMDVDHSLHRFEPYRSLRRNEAMTAMLRLLARRQPPFACLGGAAAPNSAQEVCNVSIACGLVENELDCLPTGPVPGTEALDLCRRTQEHLGAE